MISTRAEVRNRKKHAQLSAMQIILATVEGSAREMRNRRLEHHDQLGGHWCDLSTSGGESEL